MTAVRPGTRVPSTLIFDLDRGAHRKLLGGRWKSQLTDYEIATNRPVRCEYAQLHKLPHVTMNFTVTPSWPNEAFLRNGKKNTNSRILQF